MDLDGVTHYDMTEILLKGLLNRISFTCHPMCYNVAF